MGETSLVPGLLRNLVRAMPNSDLRKIPLIDDNRNSISRHASAGTGRHQILFNQSSEGAAGVSARTWLPRQAEATPSAPQMFLMQVPGVEGLP